MNIIKQSWEWIQKPILPLQLIELAGRTCYKSENRITNNSAKRFVKMIVKRGHYSVIEHAVASVRFITNRGVTHELVRHRLASYSQESTRYVKYNDIQVIEPIWWDKLSKKEKLFWVTAMRQAEDAYKNLLELKWKPEQARDVLPNALKTEIVMTANLREWMHVFKLRCSTRAHPQMRALMCSCLSGFQEEVPIIFDDVRGLV